MSRSNKTKSSEAIPVPRPTPLERPRPAIAPRPTPGATNPDATWEGGGPRIALRRFPSASWA
jgi:hypothetical protein